MLTQLGENLWEKRRRIRLLGPLRIPRRMTVVRLEDGGLWVHSPNRLDDETKRELDALGPVKHLVSPNYFHHFFVEQYVAAYPEARLYGAPGLAKKREDLSFHETLGAEAPEPWAEQIDQVATRGSMFREIVFRHAASNTLILTDLAFSIGPDEPFLTRCFARLNGVYQRLGPTPLERLLVRDKPAFWTSLQPVFGWDIERILVAHGDVVMGDAETIRAPLARYFGPRRG